MKKLIKIVREYIKLKFSFMLDNSKLVNSSKEGKSYVTVSFLRTYQQSLEKSFTKQFENLSNVIVKYEKKKKPENLTKISEALQNIENREERLIKVKLRIASANAKAAYDEEVNNYKIFKSSIEEKHLGLLKRLRDAITEKDVLSILDNKIEIYESNVQTLRKNMDEFNETDIVIDFLID